MALPNEQTLDPHSELQHSARNSSSHASFFAIHCLTIRVLETSRWSNQSDAIQPHVIVDPYTAFLGRQLVFTGATPPKKQSRGHSAIATASLRGRHTARTRDTAVRPPTRTGSRALHHTGTESTYSYCPSWKGRTNSGHTMLPKRCRTRRTDRSQRLTLRCIRWRMARK